MCEYADQRQSDVHGQSTRLTGDLEPEFILKFSRAMTSIRLGRQRQIAQLFRTAKKSGHHQTNLPVIGNGVGDTLSEVPFAFGSNGCQSLPTPGSELKAASAQL